MVEQIDKHTYLEVQDQSFSWGIGITTVGFQSVPPHGIYPMKVHPKEYMFNFHTGRVLNEFQMIYVTKGNGLFKTKDSEYNINQGEIIVIYPNEWHTYFPNSSQGWEVYWVGFKASISGKPLLSDLFQPKSQVLDIGINEEIVALYNKIFSLSSKNERAHLQVLSSITVHLLGLIKYLNNNYKIGVCDSLQEKINSAKVLISQFPEKDINMKEIAIDLNMSYSNFRKNFKEKTGYSPQDFFINTKLEKAKSLLLETDLTVQEIAFELNFNSDSYFITLFKNKVGYTPTKYRFDHLRMNN